MALNKDRMGKKITFRWPCVSLAFGPWEIWYFGVYFYYDARDPPFPTFSHLPDLGLLQFTVMAAYVLSPCLSHDKRWTYLVNIAAIIEYASIESTFWCDSRRSREPGIPQISPAVGHGHFATLSPRKYLFSSPMRKESGISEVMSLAYAK